LGLELSGVSGIGGAFVAGCGFGELMRGIFLLMGVGLCGGAGFECYGECLGGCGVQGLSVRGTKHW
jgi:hypothetical protein